MKAYIKTKKHVGKALLFILLATVFLTFAGCGKKVVSEDHTIIGGPEPIFPPDGDDPNRPVYVPPLKVHIPDFGSFNVVIKDWWTDYNPQRIPSSDYEQYTFEYREWFQENYNLKIHREAATSKENALKDFRDYVFSGGDENNYLYVLPADSDVLSLINEGALYDLSVMQIPDDLKKAAGEREISKYPVLNYGEQFFGICDYEQTPGIGVYFNKNILKSAGVEPEMIYDLQKKNEWTFAEFEKLMETVDNNLTSNGSEDICPLSCDESVMTRQAVFSNGGSFVGKTEEGRFYSNLESEETLYALNWVKSLYEKYEGTSKDNYAEKFLNHQAAFLVEEEKEILQDGYLKDADFEYGFVMFPIGPMNDTYVNVCDSTFLAVPGQYDEQRVLSIVCGWLLYGIPSPGMEDVNFNVSYAECGNCDKRAATETVFMMSQPEYGVYDCTPFIEGIDMDYLLENIGRDNSVEDVIQNVRDNFRESVDSANVILGFE